MNEVRSFIIAIGLSILILAGWQYFVEMPKKEKLAHIAHQQQQQVLQSEHILKQQLVKQGAVLNKPIDREAVLAEGARIRINNPRLQGSISLKGARIDDLTLLDYKETIKRHSPKVQLLSPTETTQAYFIQFGWIDPAGEIAVPGADTVWQTEDTSLSPDKPATLHWDNGKDAKFYITISLDKDYMFHVKQKVENYGNKPFTLLPFGLVNRAWMEDHEAFAILHEGPLGVMDNALHEFSYKDLMEDKSKEFQNTTGWIGTTDKYWLTAIIPQTGNSYNTKFSYTNRAGQNRFQSDFLGKPVEIAPGTTTDTASDVFAGAKVLSILERYEKDLHIPLFERAVDFGAFYFITKPLFLALRYFHSLLGNFGLAILLLTVCVKLLMYPLANKSYVSIHKIKLLQPELNRLREIHKDNKAQLNQEVMIMYRKNKVNPLSGCLPILVQIPVFFSLYKVLFITIEMRHASFYGWVKDLSAPDPTTVFNLFGLIPWDPPAMLMIGAWPIIMGITMILQQRMNPEPSDPVQAKVMKLLPFIFTFIFAAFPVGLIIYWAWNNSLSVLQQWVITRSLK